MAASTVNKIDYLPFSNACAVAATNITTFRQHAVVIDMLEHVPPDLVPQYMARIKVLAEGRNIPWDQIAKWDVIGQPRQIPVQVEPNKTVNLAPTTVRYVFLALMVLTRLASQIKSLPEPVHIIEIGGGYGGQCSVMFRLAPAFGLTIESYTIFDLPHVHKLQSVYLSKVGVQAQLLNINDPGCLAKLAERSFLFSAYAYSEIDTRAQYPYNMALKNRVPHGFLVWNRPGHPTPDFHTMIGRDRDQMQIVAEAPQTGAHNRFMSW